jgi:hypothetical protein
MKWREGQDVAASSDILDVAQRPGLRLRREGPDWVAACPDAKRGGRVKLVIKPDEGRFVCRCHLSGGDVVDLAICRLRLGCPEACAWVQSGSAVKRPRLVVVDGDPTSDEPEGSGRAR